MLKRKNRKKQSNFKEIEKNCKYCGIKIKLNNTRDIIRKKYCSQRCNWKYFVKEKNIIPPRPTKETRKKAGETLRERIKLGLIHKPLRKKITHLDKYCKECNKRISRCSVNNMCKLCFNKAKECKAIVECLWCKKEIKVQKHLKNRNNYCSKECSRYKIRQCSQKKTFSCMNCGKKFERFASQFLNKEKTYCSKKCSVEKYQRSNKEKSSFYIDGRTPLSKLIRNSSNYYRWICEILKRDEFKCTNCNSMNNLHVHHIKKFSIILNELLLNNKQYNVVKDKEILLTLAYNHEEFWDIKNGITLCNYCHEKSHPELNLNLTVVIGKKIAIN